MRTSEIGLDLSFHFFNDGEAAVDFGNDAVLLGKGRGAHGPTYHALGGQVEYPYTWGESRELSRKTRVQKEVMRKFKA